MAYFGTTVSTGKLSTRGGARRVTIINASSASRVSLLSNLRELADYTDLLYTLTVHRIKVRYKQSVLGVAWAIIQPASMMVIFTAVFSLIGRMPSEGAPYAIFAYAALLPWNYFSTGVTNATGGLVSHSQLITKVYFPRIILPVSYVLAALFDFIIASSVLVALMFYYRIPLTMNALYAVPLILVLILFSIAVALVFSATQVRFRDIGIAVPLLLQLWMFATPIIYPLSAVPIRFRMFYMLNPLVGIIESFRRVILRSQPPDFQSLSVSAVISVILLVVSLSYFKRVEATMADII
jgi:lipopolysaccharide transport system permease protein